MTVKFTFSSGKEVEYDYDWEKLAPKLQLGGMRLFGPQPGVLIPLNSNTIALIEDTTIYDEVPEEHEPEVGDMKTEVTTSEPPPEYPEEVEKKLSIEEKKEAILNDMKEMSECVHEEHDIYYQEIMAGPRNNRQAQKRYFPVCAKCGVRERYVKADSLSDEQKENAKKWDK